MRRFIGLLATLGALAVLQAGCCCLVSKPAAPKFVLRVNAGADEAYTDKAGNLWLPEKMYTKGGGYGFVGDELNRIYRGEIGIEGTDDPAIYRTERWSMEKFIAEVPDGKYTVRLHFAETYPDIDIDGPRIFDVKIQGKAVLKDFNVSKQAGGVRKALVKTFRGIEVNNGMLEITFVPNMQNPEINGIEIIAE